MVTTRTCTYSIAPSLKLRSRNIRFVDIQRQPRTRKPPIRDDLNPKSSMQLYQDSASLVRDGACLVSSTMVPPAAIGSQTWAPHLEIIEPANPDIHRSTHSNTPDISVYILQKPSPSCQGESCSPIAQEPVASVLQENDDPQQTLYADLLCEVETAKSTPGTQNTKLRSQEYETGSAESPRGESWTSTCEDTHSGSISQRILTASAAPREPTSRDPRDMQSTDLTPQEPGISDFAREIATVSCDSSQGTETETSGPASCHEPEAANSTLINKTTDADHIDVTNVLPKFSTAKVESLNTGSLDALGTKATNPPQEPNRRSISKEDGRLAHLASDKNNGHSPTDTSLALVGDLGDTNENPIVLDDSTAGDSRYNPIEIPDKPTTQRSRKRRHSSNISDGRYKFQCRTEPY